MIKQKVELLEVLTNCEQKNRYHSYAWDPQLGEKKPTEGLGEELFKFKEDSDCCIRIMCVGRERAAAAHVKDACYSMIDASNSPSVAL